MRIWETSSDVCGLSNTSLEPTDESEGCRNFKHVIREFIKRGVKVITSDSLEPVFVVGFQQVRVGDDSSWQDLPEEGQISLSYPGERESVGDGIGGWCWSVSLSVQPLRTDPKLPQGAQLKATMEPRGRGSVQSPGREGATQTPMRYQDGP